MYPRRNFIVPSFVVLCLCVVFAKNVEHNRSKRTTSGLESCESVKPFFQMRNITLSPLDNTKGNICGGQCCSDRTEKQLRKQGQRDFAELLRHNSRSLQGLLSSTAATLQNHVSELARQSENKTLQLLSQIYQELAVFSRDPIISLYADIRNIITVTSHGESSSVPDIKVSVQRFFADLFPLVYYSLTKNSTKGFTEDYKVCLKKTIDTIQPYGEVPSNISESLNKSLEATRLLLQAFQIGTQVLNTTDTLLIDENSGNNFECHNALLKMTYCPRCQGLAHTKPCVGYCLNVLRGCITKYVAELDLPWNGYVEGIESLVSAMKKSNENEAGVNAPYVLRNLDSSITTAIMRTMEKSKDIYTRVSRSCGQPDYTDEPLLQDSSTPSPSHSGGGKPRITNSRVFSPMPDSELAHFLNAIAKTKGFYGNLADTLCRDESFAEPKDQRCWNGQRIAEYTKTVVDIGTQKYNPEVKPNPNEQNVDPRVADLVDKLRHVHHMAFSSYGSAYGDVDYMQRDGAEGSGSGDGPPNFGDDDDLRGSGSGGGAVGPDEGDPRNDITVITSDGPTIVQNPTNTVHTGGGSTLLPSPLLTSLVFITFNIITRYY